VNKKDSNVSRRKFMAASSAVIAAPFVMNMAGKVAEAGAAEKVEATSTGKKTYFINDNCILCPPLPCKTNCPVKAIWFDGDKFAIDTEKCIRCGTCVKGCEIGAIVDINAPFPEIKPHDIIRKSCDFLVLGGGTAGLIAATIAAELSGKKVIILEKAKKPGGSGFYALGIRLFSTKWQRDAGVPDQMDDYIRSAMNITGWELNPQLVANSFRALRDFFDWFCTWGKAEEIWTMTDSRFSKRRKSMDIKNMQTARTRKIMHRIIDKCNELGVEILTEYTATEFIMGDRGEITGVKTKDPGGTTIVNCKYCLVSTGNLASCGPLLARCIPEYANVLKRRTGHRLPTNTGDGVLMAEKAGIPINYNSVCVSFTGPNSCLAEPLIQSLDQRGEGLFVNLQGKRWVNETFIHNEGNVNDFLPVLLRQPKCMFYNVMDSKIITMNPLPTVPLLIDQNPFGRNVEGGVPDPDEKESDSKSSGPTGEASQPQTAVESNSKEGTMSLAEGISKSELIKELQRIASLPERQVVIADTLEELADKMGVERKTFLATVKRYNELCAKGHDDDYYKPVKYILPIEKAPFYASSHYQGLDGINGGLEVNENMQVMGKNGPIENLYASGDTTGSRYVNRGGQRYEIINDMSWAVASGFLAGQHIGKQLKKS
jgi:fumarate reductase flavoprotein subunit